MQLLSLQQNGYLFLNIDDFTVFPIYNSGLIIKIKYIYYHNNYFFPKDEDYNKTTQRKCKSSEYAIMRERILLKSQND